MSHEQIKPNTADQDLYPRLDSNGEPMRDWVSTDEIPAQFRDRLSEKNRRTGLVRAYKNRGMELVPELRERLGDWQDRVLPQLQEGQIDAAGTLIRGSDIESAQQFVHPHGDLPIASGSALAVTAHRNDTPDPYGLQVVGETAQEVADSVQNFSGRISRSSKYDNGDQREDIVVSPILPGTISGSDKRITTGDIDSKPLAFASHAVDFQTFAYFDPNNQHWTGQNVPFGNYTGHPWQTPKNYASGVLTGIIAYQFKDGIYVLNPDAHIERLLRNIKEIGFSGASDHMVRQMLREHLIANKRWVPSANANIADPEDQTAETFGNRYYLRFTANSDGFAPPLVTARREIALEGSPVGPYKTVDKLNIVQLGDRPVSAKAATRKDTGNYQEPVRAFLEGVAALKAQDPSVVYHEALFTANLRGENRRFQEGTGSNFAVVYPGARGHHTIAMPDTRDILDGTTIKLLGRLAAANGWKVEERAVTLNELRNAGASKGKKVAEVISTGTAMGFKGVGTIRNVQGEVLFQAGDENPVTTQLQNDLSLLMLRRHPNTALNGIMTKLA